MTPLNDEQKKKVNLMVASGIAGGALFAFLLTSLILNKKYARLEAQYWGM
jgi:hypothetical protein